MFNWSLFAILMILSIPGILFLIPTTRNIYKALKTRFPKNKKLPSQKSFIRLSILQTLILVAAAAALGTATAPQVGLQLLSSEELLPQFLAALIVGGGGAVIFLSAYYFIFRPRLDKSTLECMEKLRRSAGLGCRIFYGGVVEEILSRWGLMSFFVWVGATSLGQLNSFIMWLAILLSGLLFGIGHLPSYLAFGCKKSASFMTAVISLNLWASLIFGWLFWHYGLVSAMLAHALFHLIWYPFDRSKKA